MKAGGGSSPGSQKAASRSITAWPQLHLKTQGCGPAALPPHAAVWLCGLLLVLNPNRTQVVLESRVRWKKEMA